MDCKNPMIYDRKAKQNGKKGIIGSLNTISCSKEQLNQYITQGRYQLIPCGQCLSCRLKKAGEWAVRGYCEMKSRKEHKAKGECVFLTLTYDENNVPLTLKSSGQKYARNGERLRGTIIDQTGTAHFGQSPENPAWLDIEKGDIEKFIKDLRNYEERKQDGQKIRYMLCGEYGGNTARPHFHMIVWGLIMPDWQGHRTRQTRNGKNVITFRSETLDKLWGKGMVDCEDCNYRTISYVAQYTVKKIKNEREVEGSWMQFLNELGTWKNEITQPYIAMSKSGEIGGLGMQYYQDHKDEIFRQGYILVNQGNETMQAAIPRAFKRKYKEEKPLEYAIFEEKQAWKQKISIQNEMSQTNLALDEYQERKAKAKEERIKMRKLRDAL